MLFYLDYSVYGLLADRGQQNDFNRYLREHHDSVITSSAVLIEAQRAPDEVRLSRFSAIRQIARHFLHPPSDYRETQEVVRALRRMHPEWLHQKPDLRQSDELLRWRYAFWTELRNKGSVDMDLSVWLSLTDPRIKGNKGLHKYFRQQEQGGATLTVTTNDHELAERLESVPNSERYWRVCACEVYWHALSGDPAAQDHRDWLMPYLCWGIFSRRQWAKFWLVEVPAASVPRNRIRNLIPWFQLSRRFTHGNYMDATHAAHLLDCDVFLTCDRDFHVILSLVTGDAGPRVATPVLVDRGAKDAVMAIDAALRSQGFAER